MIKAIVEDSYKLDISKIVLGRLRGIRDNVRKDKANIMRTFGVLTIIVRRFKEEAGIWHKVEEKSEYKTSRECPLYRSEGTRKRRGLFYCGKCQKTMNADVVGVLNTARNDGSIISSPS